MNLEHETHDHDLGLSHDLPKLLNRRRALLLFGGVGIATISGCSAASSSAQSSAATAAASSAAASPTESASTTSDNTTQIPEETAGPFPADGSNGANVLTESGVVRSDITSSFGATSTVAVGVPLTIKLKILDIANGAAGLAGAAVYLWHCDINGDYSMYSQSIEDENYLRGVEETGADGTVTFTSIYPGCYSGRWPHIHFEVYSSLAKATSAGEKLRTSQVALPEDASKLVYATDGYSSSVSNLSQVSLASDMVFSDGWSLQLGTVTGDVTDGMTVSLNVPV